MTTPDAGGLAESEIARAAFPYTPVVPGSPHPRASRARRRLRRILIALTVAVALVVAYVVTALLWPLPAAKGVVIEPLPAAVTSSQVGSAWPSGGSAAVAVDGVASTTASDAEQHAIASVAKLVTALVVLDRLPLALGDDGPSYAMTAADHAAYLRDRAAGESVLGVPVGGSLTERQLLEGILIASANNYADRLAGELWPSDAAYADAAHAWLEAHGIPGLSIVEPSGIDPANRADAASLVPLAEAVLGHPVLAEIVATREVDIPGAGLVRNTNGLLADPGVVGVKTGTLDAHNLVAAKEVVVDDSTVLLVAATLGQPSDAARLEVTRRVLDAATADLAPQTVLPDGTVVGAFVTPWGSRSDVVTAGAATARPWAGTAPSTTVGLALGDDRAAGASAGELTMTDALGATRTPLRLASPLTAPDPLWRLTHPLTLLGL